MVWAGGISVPALIRGQCDACLKRLEAGVFRFPTATDAATASCEIRASELAMLLDGVVLEKLQRGRRYHRPATSK